MWADYLRKLRKQGRHHNPKDWQSFEDDIAEHAAVSFSEFDGAEIDRLRSALAQVGSPESVATAFVMEFSPSNPAPWMRIVQQLTSLGAMLLTSIIVVIAITAFGMGVANIFNPDVGIWVHADGSWSLSFEAQSNSMQLFRRWFSLLAIATAVLLSVSVVALGKKRPKIISF